MTSSAQTPPTPRDAATLILIRRDGDAPRVLMGQRGKGASFMPSKFVFPGGALDAEDRDLAHLATLKAPCAARLERDSPPGLGPALAMAAIRETFEETGLALARPAPEAAGLARTTTDSWRALFARGLTPVTDRLTFVFRAITPHFRPKRFDARFFLTEADAIHGDREDFSGASGELSHLSWLTLAEARAMPLPLITEIVLAEVADILDGDAADRPAPFFHHRGGGSYFDLL